VPSSLDYREPDSNFLAILGCFVLLLIVVFGVSFPKTDEEKMTHSVKGIVSRGPNLAGDVTFLEINENEVIRCGDPRCADVKVGESVELLCHISVPYNGDVAFAPTMKECVLADYFTRQ
jgi:hypothetical protein